MKEDNERIIDRKSFQYALSFSLILFLIGVRAGPISGKFMKDSFSFIFKNLFPILIVTLGLFYLAVIYKVFDIDIEKKVNDTYNKIYKFEKMGGLCDSDDLGKMCEKLGKGKGKRSRYSCNTVSCCVWAKSKNGGFCVEGDKGGPLFTKDKHKTDYDSYWYLNKKYTL